MKRRYRLEQQGLSPLQVDLEHIKGETDIQKAIANLEDDIAQLNIEIENNKSITPLNTVEILTLINTKELKERAIKQTNELYDELF